MDIVDDETYFYLLRVSVIVFIITSLVGVYTNAINLKIFWKMGLRDSVTISFFYLSITDFGVLLTTLMLEISVILHVLEEPLGFVLIIIHSTFTFYCQKLREMIYTISVWTTTFVAIQRCLCVYKPLHINSFFTVYKTVLILGIFTSYTLVSYTPIFAAVLTTQKFDTTVNLTRIMLKYTSIKDEMWDFDEAQNGVIFPVVTQIIVMVCLVVMGKTLHEARQRRQKMMMLPRQHDQPSNSTTDVKTKDAPPQNSLSNLTEHVTPQATVSTNETPVTSDRPTIRPEQLAVQSTRHLNTSSSQTSRAQSDSVASKTAETRNNKEYKVIKAVALVSIVFVVCNSPKIAISLARQLFPAFDILKPYHNTVLTMSFVRIECEVINAAINLVIYYNFNPKFRSVFKSNRS